MPFATVASVGAAALGTAGVIGGALINANSASKAASATQQSDAAAVAEQQREFNIAQGNESPWLTTGASALDTLANIYGLQTSPTYTPGTPAASTTTGGTGSTTSGGYTYNTSGLTSFAAPGRTAINNIVSAMESGQSPAQIQKLETAVKDKDPNFGTALQTAISSAKSPTTSAPATVTATSSPVASGTQTAPDYSSFYESPDYQFAMSQGLKGVQASAAANGSLESGATDKAEESYASNLASENFNQYANRLQALAGVGQTAANADATTGTNTANQVSNILENEGQNTASSYLAQGNAYANGISQLAGIGGSLLNNSGSGSGGVPGSSLDPGNALLDAATQNLNQQLGY